MRYCLSARIPEPKAILLVESGSRGIVESVISSLRDTWGQDIPIDLVSCYANLPRGFDAQTTGVYRVGDFRGRRARAELYRTLAGKRYSLIGIVCSGEPLMTKWKWVLALRLRAKVFVINENGDYFWLDRKHLKPIGQIVLLRAGLAGAGAVRTLARVFLFPLSLVYLLLYASIVHARRALRRGLA
jgi:hypothetical protein